MTTLGTMKSRIADELARDDLTANIASAITTAIESYQTERFFFNESRDVTFQTAALTPTYSALTGDVTIAADLLAIDWMSIVLGNIAEPLDRMPHTEMEALADANSQTGQPTDWSYFNKQIRLYPVPTEVWTVRVGAHVRKAAPATDNEAGNAWMTDAERLIRSRAKMELAIHVMRNSGMAAAMAGAVDEAFDELKGRTAKMVGTGRMRAMRF